MINEDTRRLVQPVILRLDFNYPQFLFVDDEYSVHTHYSGFIVGRGDNHYLKNHIPSGNFIFVKPQRSPMALAGLIRKHNASIINPTAREICEFLTMHSVANLVTAVSNASQAEISNQRLWDIEMEYSEKVDKLGVPLRSRDLTVKEVQQFKRDLYNELKDVFHSSGLSNLVAPANLSFGDLLQRVQPLYAVYDINFPESFLNLSELLINTYLYSVAHRISFMTLNTDSTAHQTISRIVNQYGLPEMMIDNIFSKSNVNLPKFVGISESVDYTYLASFSK